MDVLGNTLWQHAYEAGPEQGDNAAEFLSLTSDGGYLLVNDSDSVGEVVPNNFGFMPLGFSSHLLNTMV